MIPSLDPRILVIDDEPDVAELVAVVLQRNRFEVEIVHSGAAALERIAATPYALIICDVVMPGMNGIAVHRAVQQRPEPRPLMLFLSGYYDAGGYEGSCETPVSRRWQNRLMWRPYGRPSCGCSVEPDRLWRNATDYRARHWT